MTTKHEDRPWLSIPLESDEYQTPNPWMVGLAFLSALAVLVAALLSIWEVW
jgi:hypothetical protein